MRPIPFQHLLASRGIRPVVNRPLEDSLRLELDPGEAEAIACAVEANAKLLLIDERRGRMVALPRGRSVGARIGNHQGAKRPSKHERRRVVPPFGQNIA
jgi:predicted nucleic acid-binding protein